MPGAPPTIASVPYVPLCTLRRVRVRDSGRMASRSGQSSLRPFAFPRSASRPSACTVTTPAASSPSPVRRPGFSAMNVAVAVARITGSWSAPVSASSPVGTSSASTGAPQARAQATSAAYSPATGRVRPMPNSASTTSAGATFRGSRIVDPPAATNAACAARASAGSVEGSPRNTTSTSWNARRSSRATTKPSAPLLRGPACTRLGPPRESASIACATAAATVPARSIRCEPA